MKSSRVVEARVTHRNLTGRARRARMSGWQRLPRLRMEREDALHTNCQDPLEASPKNVSSPGLYFESSTPPTVGETIHLYSETGTTMRGRVVYAQLCPNGKYGFEVQFLEESHDDPEVDVSDPREEAVPHLNGSRQTNGINQEAFQYYPSLSRVRKFVTENYTEPLSLDDAARVAAMEKTYFSKYFSKKVGLSYCEWVRQLRIQKAIELMKAGDHSITEIAFSVGFGSLRAFQRAFQKCVNQTPREFKKTVEPLASV